VQASNKPERDGHMKQISFAVFGEGLTELSTVQSSSVILVFFSVPFIFSSGHLQTAPVFVRLCISQYVVKNLALVFFESSVMSSYAPFLYWKL
jgi:hypothetical protein